MSKYKTANHRGGLKECIATEQEITNEVAKKLIKAKIYVFYAYDERIKAKRYILVDMDKNIGLPTWINEYE